MGKHTECKWYLLAEEKNTTDVNGGNGNEGHKYIVAG